MVNPALLPMMMMLVMYVWIDGWTVNPYTGSKAYIFDVQTSMNLETRTSSIVNHTSTGRRKQRLYAAHCHSEMLTLRRWLQLRFDCISTALRQHGRSTLRP